MTKKYTPGPWRVVKAGGIVRLSSVSGWPYKAEDDCIVDKDGKEVLGVSEWIRVEEDDLFLMSLAPELLEALEAAKDIIGHPDDPFSVYMNELITKAKGE